ncbi:hypothetical protein ACGFX8_35735 [Streptomyces sp. NPDC048362]|uniref:hypothetical protein n=1 Tax=Streptomyces sp. NPDC048362 TaxID=3365539 RepID=UPI003718FE77
MQWALAVNPPPELKAMVVQRATRRLRRRLRDVIAAQPPRGAYVSALGGEVPWLDD